MLKKFKLNRYNNFIYKVIGSGVCFIFMKIYC